MITTLTGHTYYITYATSHFPLEKNKYTAHYNDKLFVILSYDSLTYYASASVKAKNYTPNPTYIIHRLAK
jgi:hypothetical protein